SANQVASASGSRSGSSWPTSSASSTMVAGRRPPSRWSCSSAFGAAWICSYVGGATMTPTLSEVTAVLADVLPHLRCPVCRQPLAAPDGPVRCPTGHSFDVARQGYLNLTRGRLRHPGDTPAMVAARESFLATGALDFVPDELARLAGTRRGLVVDVGAGTGHQLRRLLDT